MLCAAVIPERDAVAPPAEAHLIFGNLCLADEVVHQIIGLYREVLAVTHVLWGVVIDEVAGETADEEDLLARLRMRTDYRMLSTRRLGGELCPLLRWQGCTEGIFDAVLCAQTINPGLNGIREFLVGLDHVDPDRVAADFRRFHATQHATEGRTFSPRRVAVEG